MNMCVAKCMHASLMPVRMLLCAPALNAALLACCCRAGKRRSWVRLRQPTMNHCSVQPQVTYCHPGRSLLPASLAMASLDGLRVSSHSRTTCSYGAHNKLTFVVILDRCLQHFDRLACLEQHIQCCPDRSLQPARWPLVVVFASVWNTSTGSALWGTSNLVQWPIWACLQCCFRDAGSCLLVKPRSLC